MLISDCLQRDQSIIKAIPSTSLMHQNDILLVKEQSIELVFPLVEGAQSSSSKDRQSEEHKGNSVNDLYFQTLKRRTFSSVIRDALVVEHNSEKLVLVYLQTGSLAILDHKLQAIGNFQIANHMFDKSAAPLLKIEYLNNHLALQTSGKKISLYKVDPAAKFDEAITKKPSFIFKEPDSNVVYDYCLIKDWRKAVEEMDEYMIGETIAIATLTLDPVGEQSIFTIHRLWLSTSDYRIQQVFHINASILTPVQPLQAAQLNQSFTKIAHHSSNPILTLFTDKQVIFLDQRKLQMINYNRSEMSGCKNPTSICSSYQYVQEGRQLVCLMDSQEVLMFSFSEDYDLNVINNKHLQNYQIPQSGVISCIVDDLIAIFNHFGRTYLLNSQSFTMVQFKENYGWTMGLNQICQNTGPTLDFEVSNRGDQSLIGTSITSVSGLAPYSALYEHRLGVEATKTVSFGSLECAIQDLWSFKYGNQEFLVITFADCNTTRVLEYVEESSLKKLEEKQDGFGLELSVLTLDVLQISNNQLLQIFEYAQEDESIGTTLAIQCLVQGKRVFQYHLQQPLGSFNLSLQGDTLLFAFEEVQKIGIMEINLVTYQVAQRALGLKLDPHTEDLSSMAFIDNKKLLYSIFNASSRLSQLYITQDLLNTELLQKVAVNGRITTMCYYQTKLALCTTDQGQLYLLDPFTQEVVTSNKVLRGLEGLGRLKLKQNDKVIVYVPEETLSSTLPDCQSLMVVPKDTFTPTYMNYIASSICLMPPSCKQRLLSLKEDSKALEMVELQEELMMNRRLLCKAPSNIVFRRVKEMAEGQFLITGDLCQTSNKSVVMVYDKIRNKVTLQQQTEKIMEVDLMQFTTNEDIQKVEQIVIIGFQFWPKPKQSRPKEQQPSKGKIRMYRVVWNSTLMAQDFIQIAPASDFPTAISAICPNFGGLNQVIIGSGQYLFWFQIEKTTFEYSMKCIKYLRLRSPIRSITWQKRMGSNEIVVADCEEGVSIFVNEGDSNIQLKAFDPSLKQLIYARHIQVPKKPDVQCNTVDQSLSQCTKILGLDYDGTLYLFDKVATNNPLMKLNQQSVLCHPYHELIRKIETHDNCLFLMGLRGSLYKIRVEELSDQRKVSSMLSDFITQKDQGSQTTGQEETSVGSANELDIYDQNNHYRFIDYQLIKEAASEEMLRGFYEEVLKRQGLPNVLRTRHDLDELIKNI